MSRPEYAGQRPDVLCWCPADAEPHPLTQCASAMAECVTCGEALARNGAGFMHVRKAAKHHRAIPREA